jgi:hypothetical protein
MAAPIAHIVTATEFMQRYPTAKLDSSFIVGASFPDIRYLGVIRREATHDPEPSLRKILDAPTPFEAGTKHHALVDVIREKFLHAKGAYALIPKGGAVVPALKLFEDERLYRRSDDWDAIKRIFEDVSDGEREYGIADTDLARWNGLRRKYVAEAPSRTSRFALLHETGFTDDTISEIETIILSLRKNDALAEIIDAMYQDFTSLLR